MAGTVVGTLGLYTLAAIAGCFAVWAWLWRGRSLLRVVPGLVAFAWLLTRIGSDFAGRACAACGGVYVVAALLRLRAVERPVADRWDGVGGAIGLVGADVVLCGPRAG